MKILLIQTAFIGDVVLTTPLIAALRERFPGSEVHVVATPQGARMLEGLPGVVCHTLDKRNHGAYEGMKNVLGSLQLSEALIFDLVFCVHRSLRSLLLGQRVPAAKHIAFASFWSRILGYQTVPYPPYDESTHYADKPLALLKAVGSTLVPTRTQRPMLTVSARDEQGWRAKAGALPERGYVILSPFSVWGTKMWFADRFARLGSELFRRYKLPIVVVGSDDPREITVGQTIVEKIIATCGEAVSVVGKTDVGELKAAIRGARLVISNDSAPVHIASAFDVPTVAIFGPTVKKWGFFPLSSRSAVVERAGLECRPCHIHGPETCPKGHFKCMDEIQVEEVVKAVRSIID